MNEKKKKNTWLKYISSACFLALGGICGFLIAWYFMDVVEGKDLPELLFLFSGMMLIVYFAMIVQIVIHEAGHMVFGMLSGYRFCSFRIFSFMWIKDHGKLKFSRFSLAGTGGQCLMAPPDFKNGTIPVMLYNFGGSIMNAAAGLLFLLLYSACGQKSLLAVTALIFAVVGFGFAVINGVPLHAGQVDNDGYNALSLSRSRKAQFSFWMQMKVNSRTAEGIRLKDMPDEWFVIPSDEEMKNSIVAVQGVLAASRMMDAMKFDEADQLIEHILSIDSGIVGLHRHLLTCERMYVEMTGKNRRDVIDRMMTKDLIKLMKVMKNYPAVLRTGYVYALFVQRDAAEAERIKVLFEKNAAVYPYPSEAEAERELMRHAERELKKRTN
ncbi:MAG: hypothetical protein HFH29_10865 [Eubacterium sp.]|nr:hypothetical protein [Eubacterium sp.]